MVDNGVHIGVNDISVGVGVEEGISGGIVVGDFVD
jgi:hypothetical protein